MITFKQFLAEGIDIDAPHGIFVQALPTNDSIACIRDRVFDLEHIQPLTDDWHCTLLYTQEPVKQVWLPHWPKDVRWSARGASVEYWSGHDNSGYAVLTLDSPDLQAAHAKLEGLGANHQFPEYRPHVSLLHPVQWSDSLGVKMSEINLDLRRRPLDLEFRPGGYTFLEAENG